MRERVYVFAASALSPTRSACSFTSLGDFFQRPLKPGVRPIDSTCAVVSPADCKVLTVGCTQDDVVLQVKGLPYSLSALLGAACAPRPGCSTHYCVLYLAPGDYHRFHSPTSVNVSSQLSPAPMLQPAVIYVTVAEMHAFCRRAAARQPTRRLQGLASLRVHHCAPRGHSTGILSQHAQVPSLFVRNERACILGTWALKGMDNCAVGEGLKFGMAAVGAYNVGGITLICNPSLQSNASQDDGLFDGGAVRSVVDIKPDVSLAAGDMVGSFRIGSTLVLAVEVPDHWNFSFACKSGDKMRVGQALGRVDPAFAAAAAAK